MQIAAAVNAVLAGNEARAGDQWANVSCLLFRLFMQRFFALSRGSTGCRNPQSLPNRIKSLAIRLECPVASSTGMAGQSPGEVRVNRPT